MVNKNTCTNLLVTGKNGLPVGHCFSFWHDILGDSSGVTTHRQRLCFRCGGSEKETMATGEVVYIPETMGAQ